MLYFSNNKEFNAGLQWIRKILSDNTKTVPHLIMNFVYYLRLEEVLSSPGLYDDHAVLDLAHFL